jgi:hypothetical protein
MGVNADRVINKLPAHIWAGIAVILFGLGLILLSDLWDAPRINNPYRDDPGELITVPTQEPLET